jgi:hypothetical protein
VSYYSARGYSFAVVSASLRAVEMH